MLPDLSVSPFPEKLHEKRKSDNTDFLRCLV